MNDEDGGNGRKREHWGTFILVVLLFILKCICCGPLDIVQLHVGFAV